MKKKVLIKLLIILTLILFTYLGFYSYKNYKERQRRHEGIVSFRTDQILTQKQISIKSPRIIFERNGNFYSTDLNRDDRKEIIGSINNIGGISKVLLSPNKKLLAYTAFTNYPENYLRPDVLNVAYVDGSENIELIRLNSDQWEIQGFAWDESSEKIICKLLNVEITQHIMGEPTYKRFRGELWEIPVFTKEQNLLLASDSESEYIDYVPIGAKGDNVYLRDNKLLRNKFIGSSFDNLVIMNIRKGEFKKINLPLEIYPGDLSISPDYQKICLEDAYDFLIKDINEQDWQRWGPPEFPIAWSPNSKNLAYFYILREGPPPRESTLKEIRIIDAQIGIKTQSIKIPTSMSSNWNAELSWLSDKLMLIIFKKEFKIIRIGIIDFNKPSLNLDLMKTFENDSQVIGIVI